MKHLRVALHVLTFVVFFINQRQQNIETRQIDFSPFLSLSLSLYIGAAMDLRRSSIVLLILSVLSPATLSMRYELLSGHTKCISEEIHANAMSVGKYSIVNPNDEDHPLPDSHKITVRVKKQTNTFPILPSVKFLFWW